jgi:hypothetical protein
MASQGMEGSVGRGYKLGTFDGAEFHFGSGKVTCRQGDTPARGAMSGLAGAHPVEGG